MTPDQFIISHPLLATQMQPGAATTVQYTDENGVVQVASFKKIKPNEFINLAVGPGSSDKTNG